MTAPAVIDVRPLEEHVEAMTTADSAFTLMRAYAVACSDGYAGVTVADLLCGSTDDPLLLTVEQLFAHLHKGLRRGGGRHKRGQVVPASREDGGRGPALAGGPR